MEINNIINDSPLPNELMFKILFESKGLLHPCAKIINNHLNIIKEKNKSRRKNGLKKKNIVTQLRYDKLFKEYTIELIRKYKIFLRK